MYLACVPMFTGFCGYSWCCNKMAER